MHVHISVLISLVGPMCKSVYNVSLEEPYREVDGNSPTPAVISGGGAGARDQLRPQHPENSEGPNPFQDS